MAAPSGISNAVRVFRSPAVRGSLITAAILLIVSGLRGGLDLWWLAAVTVAALTGALLAGMERRRPAPAPVAAREERLFAADTLLASIPDPVVLVDGRAVVRYGGARSTSTSGRSTSMSGACARRSAARGARIRIRTVRGTGYSFDETFNRAE